MFDPEMSGLQFLEKIDENYDNLWTETFDYDLSSEEISKVNRIGDLKSISIKEVVSGDMAEPYGEQTMEIVYRPDSDMISTNIESDDDNSDDYIELEWDYEVYEDFNDWLIMIKNKEGLSDEQVSLLKAFHKDDEDETYFVLRDHYDD